MIGTLTRYKVYSLIVVFEALGSSEPLGCDLRSNFDIPALTLNPKPKYKPADDILQPGFHSLQTLKPRLAGYPERTQATGLWSTIL